MCKTASRLCTQRMKSLQGVHGGSRESVESSGWMEGLQSVCKVDKCLSAEFTFVCRTHVGSPEWTSTVSYNIHLGIVRACRGWAHNQLDVCTICSVRAVPTKPKPVYMCRAKFTYILANEHRPLFPQCLSARTAHQMRTGTKACTNYRLCIRFSLESQQSAF